MKSLVLCVCAVLIVGCHSIGERKALVAERLKAAPPLETRLLDPSRLGKAEQILVSDLQFGTRARFLAESEKFALRKFYRRSAERLLPSDYALSAWASEAEQKTAPPLTMEVVVRNYVQRSGSSVGSERPAEVYVSSILRDPVSRETIWSGDFQFHEEALSDNLLDLPGRLRRDDGLAGGWKDARAVAEKGFDQLFSSFKKSRAQAINSLQ